MRRLLHALLALCLTATGAYAQTGTAQTKTQLNTEQGVNFPDNSSGLITPLLLRQTVVDLIASWQQAPRVNTQSGVTYIVVVDDYGKLVTFSNGSPVAVTLPQATTSFAVFNFFACNKGAGLVTITPTTSTINGSATLTLQQNQCSLIVSDATNYQATPPGAVGCGTGLSLVGGACQVSAARQTLPTTQSLTTGTNATYTTPANVLWIEVQIWGGGGGGGGGGSSGTPGGSGGNTCWNSSGTACNTPIVSATGGGGGANAATNGAPGAGTNGTSNCTRADTGSYGVEGVGANATDSSSGGSGGSTTRGGNGSSGYPNVVGNAAVANSGSGGGGGGTGAAAVVSGGGGSSGGYCYLIINNPAASYVYTIGAAGSAGGAGGNGQNGAAGGTGFIFVLEHYGS